MLILRPRPAVAEVPAVPDAAPADEDTLGLTTEATPENTTASSVDVSVIRTASSSDPDFEAMVRRAFPKENPSGRRDRRQHDRVQRAAHKDLPR